MSVSFCQFWYSFRNMKFLMWVRVCGIEPFNHMHWPFTKDCRKICRRILAKIKKRLLLFPISIHLYEDLKVLSDFKLSLYCPVHVFFNWLEKSWYGSDSRIKATTTRRRISFSVLHSLTTQSGRTSWSRLKKTQQITASLHICSICYHLSLMIVSFPENNSQTHSLCCTFLSK